MTKIFYRIRGFDGGDPFRADAGNEKIYSNRDNILQLFNRGDP
jgi:hypothetical protein